MKDYKKSVGRAIKKFRLANGMNQTELAVMGLGYSPNDGTAGQKKISKFECGEQEPRISELGGISLALEIDFAFLVKYIIKIHSRSR